MPPKRRRNNDSIEAGSTSPVAKKVRKSLSTPPRRGGLRTTASSNGKEEHVEDHESVDRNDDELALAQVTASGRPTRKRTTPSKYRELTPKTLKASINDTPTKSAVRRKAPPVGSPESDGSFDPAVDLLLKVTDEHDTIENEEILPEVHSDIDQPEDNNITLPTTTINAGYEAYFDQVSRTQKTSNNTLSKLPPLPQREYLKLIRGYKLQHADAMRALYNSHVDVFPEWSFELDQNHAICLSGYGSKRTLIQEFCARESELYADPYVVINGYHPNIDLRQICSSITTGLGSTGSDVNAVLQSLDDTKYDRIILAINNLDGPNLRNEKVQGSLTRIVMHPKVRMICSIDHVNAPLLFPSSRMAELQLIYHDATTFIPYTIETELQPDVLSTAVKTALVGDRGIKWILQTLSQNARTIFRILLLDQLESGSGMEATRLFEKASSAFAVSNKTSFNAQLGEFLDHEIIVTEREGQGEILRIPFSKEELKRLLEDIDGDAGNGSD